MLDDVTALREQLGDRYLIERELGRGGMGAVYLARDRRLDRPVALKVLPTEFAIVPELRERFLRETRMSAGFSHPNIVPVFAIEEGGTLLAFAMGFVEGESLASRVAREGPLSRRDAVRLLQDVGYALAYAHGRGVVHRDIKPDNVMIERATGRALVMDFGIARAITPVADKPGLTRVGEIVGTPEYMSPEQAAGEQVDGRADLYSLGLVAWFALAGQTAVTGESTQRILVKQLTEAIPPLGTMRADLPPALCAVVDRCCAKEANDRFANAEALVEALDVAQLATPELPVAVRLLAPALGGVVARVLVAIALLVVGWASLSENGDGSIMTFAVIALAVSWVGVAELAQDIRRLRRTGYETAELQRLLTLVQAERDEERARLANDPTLRLQRRRRVRIAAVLLFVQLAVLASFMGRRAGAGSAPLTNFALIITFFAALMGATAALKVLISSPFQRPFRERAFRAIWLSPVGLRALSLLGGWDSRSRITPDRTPIPAPPPHAARESITPSATTSSPSLAALAADVQTLRARVDALESTR